MEGEAATLAEAEAQIAAAAAVADGARADTAAARAALQRCEQAQRRTENALAQRTARRDELRAQAARERNAREVSGGGKERGRCLGPLFLVGWPLAERGSAGPAQALLLKVGRDLAVRVLATGVAAGVLEPADLAAVEVSPRLFPPAGAEARALYWLRCAVGGCG